MRLTLLLASLVLAQSALAAPCNIILMMADDFGYECVSANGGESYQTPNLDRLAATGMRFEHCHAQPLCTPTRVQLMTGRYNVRNYINFGTLLRTETTFGHLMKGAGYATGICGKWQLGGELDSPQHFGFEEACLWQQTRRPPRYANPGLEYNGAEKDFTHGEYGPTLVNDFALSFITKNKEKPFFLYYPMILTHNPFQPTPDSPDWDPTISSENKQQSPKHFADMTAYMDKMVGRIIAKLDELGIRDNTLLLFLGDNGTNTGIISRFQGTDYKGGKGTTTSHGTHVPLIASWPGRVCIYGWHYQNGTPIQPLSKVHTFPHVDYSHGIRLVARTCEVDGAFSTIDAVLADPALHVLLSDEGPFASWHYPAGTNEALPR